MLSPEKESVPPAPCYVQTHAAVYAQGLTAVYGWVLEGGICKHQWSIVRASHRGFCRGIDNSVLPQQASELIRMLTAALCHFHIS